MLSRASWRVGVARWKRRGIWGTRARAGVGERAASGIEGRTGLTGHAQLLTIWLVMTPAALDRVFAALASPARRRMLDLLQETPGCTVAELGGHFRMSDVGVLKHVRVLEKARLVLSRREGRVRRLFFNPVPIQLVYDRWTTDYSRFWTARMADIKERLEAAGGAGGGGGESTRVGALSVPFDQEGKVARSA